MARVQMMFLLHLSFSFLARVDAVTEEVRTLIAFRNDNVYDKNGTITGPVPTGLWATWNENDETPCAWLGVRCTANNTVEELDMSGWGRLIPYLERLYPLTDLSQLDLSGNYLSGFQEDIGNLSKLTRLDLSGSVLGGEMPSSISACQNMRYLALEDNFITNVSSGMRKLVNLQVLKLAGNTLSGQFPTEALGNLSSLVTLDLSRNHFEGRIPTLPNLTNIVEFRLGHNSFTGFEDNWFLGSKSLQDMSVFDNQLNGSIPSSILTAFPVLQVLNMSMNKLSDKIPFGFSPLINAGLSLDLSQNQLTGGIPTDLLLQTNGNQGCASVNVSYNLLSGNILIDRVGHSDLCFKIVDLSHNNLSGPIASNIFSSSETYVETVRLQNNQLSGDIVDVLNAPGFARTQEARFQNNLFTGDFSRIADPGIQDLKLQMLDLSDNLIRWSTSAATPDPVEATLAILTQHPFFGEFRAAGNNFSGTSLPTACFVKNNTDASSLTNGLNVLDLSNSHLQGQIFSAAFSKACLSFIQLLNFSNNDVTGPLPAGIIAEDPQFVVDVSNNNMSGPLPFIPSGSNLYNPKYFAGNDGLCGFPLAPCPEAPTKHGSGVQWWVLLITIGGSVTIAMGSCLAATWRWRLYQKQHEQDADLIRTLLERESAALMPLRELKKATDNFADTAQIGEGGFGTVYTGKLSDGTVVAIKRSKREGTAKDKEQFLNEVRILSQVNHRHLVKLLGCCMENKIALLVFEFVSNGTLQEHLQGKIEASHLSWKQRLNIAIQTADALNYLHTAAAFPIFHRDVKSANILLNKDLDAKVADFGISRLAPLHATHVSTMAVQGTMGYIDPEYYTSLQLTDKSDVYSFGVVLLELISAKPALDFLRGGDDISLVNYSRPYIQRGDLELFIDPLLTETYEDPTLHGRKSILSIGRLAMKCLDMQSRERPSMNEVLKELQQCWHKLCGTSKNLDSVGEEYNEDLPLDRIVLLSESMSGNSSMFTTESDDTGIEMSQTTLLARFRTKSMG